MIDSIKARLGSLPKGFVQTFPPAVQKLLLEDMPNLLKLLEASERARSDLGSALETQIRLNDEGKKLLDERREPAKATIMRIHGKRE